MERDDVDLHCHTSFVRFFLSISFSDGDLLLVVVVDEKRKNEKLSEIQGSTWISLNVVVLNSATQRTPATVSTRTLSANGLHKNTEAPAAMNSVVAS